MSNKSFLFLWICLLVFMFFGTGCQRLGSHNLMGGISVDREQLAGAMPAKAPWKIYVADFELDAQNFQGDQGVRGLLPGRMLPRGPEPLGQNLPHPLATGNPADKAREIVNETSEALVKGLTEQGISSVRLGSAESVLPSDGWLVSGLFTEVDEGNRLKRAVIGFGQGATQMDVQVGISDLAGKNPKAPFIIFGTVDDPKKLPGAAVTMNPYVAAAKFVMEKNATARDVRNTAEQIVAEIVKFRNKAMGKPGP